MPEKRFKTVLEIGGNVASSLKNAFNVLSGNTKKIGSTIRDLNTDARKLRSELKEKKLGGLEAANGVKKLESELARLEARIKRTRMAGDALVQIKMADLGGRMSQIGSSIKRGAIAITAGSAAMGAAMVAMMKNSADYGDNAKKAAERMGIGINELIKLKHAAKLSGVEGEQLESGITNLFKSIEKARNGGDKANILALLKLNPNKLAGMNPEEAVKTFAEAFKNLKGPYAKKKGLIAQIMTGDKKMANVLDLGKSGLDEAAKEAEELNLTINKKFAKNSELFNDNLTKIGVALKGVGNIISEHLLPVFNELSQQFIDFIKGNGEDMKKWAVDFGAYLKQNVPHWAEETKKIAQQIGYVAGKIGKIIEPLGGVKVVIGALLTLQLAPLVTGIGALGLALLAAIPAILSCATALGAMSISALPIIGTVLLIGAAITALGLAIHHVVKNWDFYLQKIQTGTTFACKKIQEFRKIWDTCWNALEMTTLNFEKNIWKSISGVFDHLDWMNSKFQWIGDSVKKVGGWFGGTNKYAPVQTIAGARAMGGPVSVGKRYLVGERGPEIFQPRTNGQIIPNGRAGGNTDNRTFNITINAAPGMNERTIADLVMVRISRQQAAFAGGALFD